MLLPMPAQGLGPNQVSTQQLLDDRKFDLDDEVGTFNLSNEEKRQVLQMLSAMEGLHQQRQAAVAAGKPTGERVHKRHHWSA